MRFCPIFGGDFHTLEEKTAFFRAFFVIFPCVPDFPWL
jgi:hypothetical protein